MLSLYRNESGWCQYAPKLDDYPWSSYACHACGHANELIDNHVMYQTLGLTVAESQHTYRKQFKID